MKEYLLQYIWQYQLYNKQELQTTDGRSLNIIRVGNWNKESGPDFLHAQIKIDGIVWFGSVEIHIHASDWKQHQHHLNPAFDNVILHVVWEQTTSILYHDGSTIPTIVLKERVEPLMMKKYEQLIEKEHHNELPCANYLKNISTLHKFSVLEKSALNRVERKATEVSQFWKNQNKDWQQTAFQWVCRAYGFKVNSHAFASIGAKLPYQHLLKERDSFEKVVALLFEVSGLMNTQSFSKKIIETAQHLRQKYSIHEYAMQRHEFRWSRLRPANFPEVRLVQLAAFLYMNTHLIEFLLHLQCSGDTLAKFDSANYLIEAHQEDFPKARILGKESIFNIIINAIAPFRYAYGMYNADEAMKESAINLLQQIPAERNRYTKYFHRYDFPMDTALESQGVLEQYHFMCQEKRCLECQIGTAIMKNHDLVVT